MKPFINRVISLLVLLLLPILSFSQSIKDVRINEIQVFNTNGLHDDFGRPVSWIELANLGYNKVNIAGCYLKANGKEYKIPYGDPRTLLPTRGFIVFYAVGDAGMGNLHTSLTLEDADCIEFYDQDGHLINTMRYNPKEMIEDVSYGWMIDSDGVEKLLNLPATTPGTTNNTLERVSQAEIFRQSDPSGVILTVTNIAVVAVVLTCLFYIFKVISYYYSRPIKVIRRRKSPTTQEVVSTHVVVTSREITYEAVAAVAAALYMFSEELHDTESNILTINKVKRMYSPWNSKIQTLRQIPYRR